MAVSPRILVVEDDDALGTLLRYNLEREGYLVALATDGEEALIQADESLPDLVVLDWMLPRREGIDILRPVLGLERQRLRDGSDKWLGIFHSELPLHGSCHPREGDHAVADGSQGRGQRRVIAQAAVHHGGQ